MDKTTYSIEDLEGNILLQCETIEGAERSANYMARKGIDFVVYSDGDSETFILDTCISGVLCRGAENW